MNVNEIRLIRILNSYFFPIRSNGIDIEIANCGCACGSAPTSVARVFFLASRLRGI